ncbi:MAG: hypothetical protein CEE43_01460 [Promethearchaeota archaeon Loki_b32]|nr:MAG: hypothetical protein CEE43_01460 [Candidatus Lokiarchaeota archaeon Loki_b32]
MSHTTISIKEDTKKELKKLQEIYKTKSMDELLKILIVQAKKKYIDNFSEDFKARLRERGLTLDDIIKSGEEIRNEILRERGFID